MTEPIFEHDRSNVYRVASDDIADTFSIAKQLAGPRRHARDQWLRAAQSSLLNIAEGNGKRSLTDRPRFSDLVRGSAFECAAIQDILVAPGGMESAASIALKQKLKRIVAMLTRLARKVGGVPEPVAWHSAAVDYDYEHEHRESEHEEDLRTVPELPCEPEPDLRPKPNGQSSFPAR